MANKDTNNFKQAINELLAGKITTDDEPVTAEKAVQKKAVKVEPVKTTEEDTTVIGNGVAIEGNIRTSAKLVIKGEVTGNVISTADLVVTGRIGGAIKGANITLTQCEINDTVTASGEVLVSQRSVINGDIQAKSIISEGTINGNITADNVTLMDGSKIVGDISCKTICINQGAALKGKLETV